MKILHVVKVRNRINGITAVVDALSSAQADIGNSVKVINFFQGGEKIEGFEKCDNSDDFKRTIENFNPDIVIFHGVVFKGFTYFSKLLNSKNIPFLIQLHGAYSRENYEKSKLKKMIYKNLILKPIVKRSKGWIFLNRFEADNFALKDWNQQCFFIPNGCENNEDKRINTFTSDSEIKFLFLSRIHLHHKGIDLLLDGLELLAKEGFPENTKFIFCGNGLEEDMIAFKSRIKPLSQWVEFRGPVFGDEKKEILEEADIFILTSRYEGFPMSVLEALSFGCPCLVSKATNVGEIIKDFHCGWVLPNQYPEEIAKTIRKSISEYKTNFRTLRENATLASADYKWDKIALQTLDLYKSMIK